MGIEEYRQLRALWNSGKPDMRVIDFYKDNFYFCKKKGILLKTLQNRVCLESWGRSGTAKEAVLDELAEIKKEIRAEIKEEKKAELTSYIENEEVLRQKVLHEMQRLAFVNIAELYDADGNILPINKMSEDTQRAIAWQKIRKEWEGKGDEATPVLIQELKLYDKTKNLENIAKYLGLYEKDNRQKAPVEMSPAQFAELQEAVKKLTFEDIDELIE
jgi:hypothetical protein